MMLLMSQIIPPDFCLQVNVLIYSVKRMSIVLNYSSRYSVRKVRDLLYLCEVIDRLSDGHDNLFLKYRPTLSSLTELITRCLPYNCNLIRQVLTVE